MPQIQSETMKQIARHPIFAGSHRNVIITTEMYVFIISVIQEPFYWARDLLRLTLVLTAFFGVLFYHVVTGDIP